jgi:hypothetical protein
MCDKLINFYDLPGMKKYMPKIEDNQCEYTGIPLNQHSLIVGSTGSGKTQTLLNYIERTSRPKDGTFDKVFMCVKKMEPPNYMLQEKLGDFLEIFLTIESFPDVKTFKDLGNKNNVQNLIIFDDCIGELDKKNKKKIDDYFTYGRSKGCTVLYLSQSYFETKIFIRRQVSFVFLCSIKADWELKRILKDYSIGDIDVDTLRKMYKYAKQKDDPKECNFLKICTYEVPIERKFSKNFLDYINPVNFN